LERVGWYKAQFPLKTTKNNFEKKKNQVFKTGEATPLYAFHPKAADRIKQLVPNAKLIRLGDPTNKGSFGIREPLYTGPMNISYFNQAFFLEFS